MQRPGKLHARWLFTTWGLRAFVLTVAFLARCSKFGQMLFSSSQWLNYTQDWISSDLTLFRTLECCYLCAKFIVTAPWRISSMNLQSRLIVNHGCVWIGSLASLTVKRKLEVSVIGFLFWLLILQEMPLSLWLAARILTSLCWCFDLITFCFGVWLPDLTYSVEYKIGPLFKLSKNN